jgi:hypothetical protein
MQERTAAGQGAHLGRGLRTWRGPSTSASRRRQQSWGTPCPWGGGGGWVEWDGEKGWAGRARRGGRGAAGQSSSGPPLKLRRTLGLKPNPAARPRPPASPLPLPPNAPPTRMPSNLAATKVRPGSLMASAKAWSGTWEFCARGGAGKGEGGVGGVRAGARARRLPTTAQPLAAPTSTKLPRTCRPPQVGQSTPMPHPSSAFPANPNSPPRPPPPHVQAAPGEAVDADVARQRAGAILDGKLGAVGLRAFWGSGRGCWGALCVQGAAPAARARAGAPRQCTCPFLSPRRPLDSPATQEDRPPCRWRTCRCRSGCAGGRRC